MQGLRHWVAKILGLKNQRLWQKLNSFLEFFFTFQKRNQISSLLL